MPAVQYAALIADLVVATKKTLGAIAPSKDTSQDPKGAVNNKDPTDQNFVHLRMRTAQDTELIVTDFTAMGNEYILVAIQSCKFKLEDELEEGEEAKI